MKTKSKKLVLFLLIALPLLSLAQEEEEIQTLFANKPLKISGFGGPVVNLTSISNDFALVHGFSGAALFNQKFYAGFYVRQLENEFSRHFITGNSYDFYFNHRGLWLGYIFMPKSVLHFNVGLQAGKGELEYEDPVLYNWYYDDFVLILQPSIEAEINLAKFMRVGLGVNFRFLNDVNEIPGYSNSDFSDIGGQISLKFGWFK